MSLADAVEGPWWETGALVRERHAPLIANRDAIADRAGLGAVFMDRIWTPMPASVTEEERAWLRKLISERHAPNLWVTGSQSAAVDRFRWYTGALLRNFTDARIMTCEMIADQIMGGSPFKATALLIPDFVLKDESEKKAEAVRRTVLGLVRKRLIQGEVTCVVAPKDVSLISRAYGGSFAEEMAIYFPAVVSFK